MMRDSCVTVGVLVTLFLVTGGCGDSTDRGQARATSSVASGVAVEVTTPSGVAMVLVPGGTFVMGSADGPEDEAPRHEVAVSAFAMDKCEVTQEQYAAFEMPDPSHFKDPKRPVEQVRWSDAALFCNERSRREGLEPCYDEVTFACNFEANGYRLPTEAEWEYSARAATNSRYCFGSDPAGLRSCACYEANSGNKTDLVGQKRPNPWGFCDLYGNVLEWCNDVYAATYYAESPRQDPRGPAEGEQRVMRGGAWNFSAGACRSSVRCAEYPGITDACFARDTFGFRCVRRLTKEEMEQLRGHGTDPAGR
jgi:formylglycine-generating enzyme required for sulfatase activity